MEKFCYIKQNKLIFVPCYFSKKFDYNKLTEHIIKKVIYILKKSILLDVIVDCDKLTMNNFDLVYSKTLIKFFEKQFPDMLNKCIIINSPRVFQTIFNIIKNFIDKETRKKIIIYNQND